MLEIERGSPGEEENALVDERRLARIDLLHVSAGLKHVRDGGELEADEVGRVRTLGKHVLASGQDTVEAVGQEVHAPRCVLMTLKHCATPPVTNTGYATRRTQQDLAHETSIGRQTQRGCG